jgi:hypothetical protein
MNLKGVKMTERVKQFFDDATSLYEEDGGA